MQTMWKRGSEQRFEWENMIIKCYFGKYIRADKGVKGF